MNEDLGLMNVWISGDMVTRGVALLLLAMSLASWVVIVLRALHLVEIGRAHV